MKFDLLVSMSAIVQELTLLSHKLINMINMEFFNKKEMEEKANQHIASVMPNTLKALGITSDVLAFNEPTKIKIKSTAKKKGRPKKMQTSAAKKSALPSDKVSA